MSLNMHERQNGLSQHNTFYKTLKYNWLCSKTSKCNCRLCCGSTGLEKSFLPTHVYECFKLQDKSKL